MALSLKKISPKTAEVQALIKQLDEYQAELYPAESNHLDPIDELARDNVLFVGVYDEGRLVGCGAVKIMDGAYGEVKRLFVKPECRGKGIARVIMETLEQYLLEKEIDLARLETGIHQTEAISLYQKCGYTECAPFGTYTEDPLSLFMEKRLRPWQGRSIQSL